MGYRDYKNLSGGCFYHVFNRGNGKMNIFNDDQDFLNLIKRIKLLLGISKGIFDAKKIRLTPLPRGAVSVISYSFMPNHYHLCLYQSSDFPISKFIHRLFSSYSKYFNRKYGHVGTLFQDQFKSVHVENNEQLLWLIDYIHQNPVKVGIRDSAKDYCWSSVREYSGEAGEGLCDLSLASKVVKDTL